MSVDQFGIHLGPLYIRFYGVILMLGVVAGAYLADKEATRRKMNSDFLWDSLFWMVIGGVVGARIWHILTPSPSLVAVGVTTQYYLTHPLDAIAVWRGGLGIPGAVIGGMFALRWTAKRQKESFLDWIDVIAPSLLLGQAIGRWGNFVNQELYGAPSDLPWAITIAPQNRLPEFANQATYHPIFLYEMLWNLTSVFFLLWLGRKYGKRLMSGDIFLAYLITYPVIRILLDFLRLDASEVAGFNANQTVMVFVLLAASITLYLRHRAPEKRKRGR